MFEHPGINENLRQQERVHEIRNSNHKPIVKQAAIDYDMEVEDVAWIYKRHPNDFYEKLEEFINHRATG